MTTENDPQAEGSGAKGGLDPLTNEGAFDTAEWAKTWELSEETLGILADKGFNSRKSFCKLTPEIVKKEFKGLQLAQTFLLQDAVDALQPSAKHPSIEPVGLPNLLTLIGQTPQGPSDGVPPKTVPQTTSSGLGGVIFPPPVVSTAGIDGNGGFGSSAHAQVPTSGSGVNTDVNALEMQQKLAQGGILSSLDILKLVGNIQQGPSASMASVDQAASHGRAQTFDPFQFELGLGGVASKKNKPRDLRDYIAGLQPNEDQDPTGTITIGSVEMALKDKRIGYDKIRMTQFMEANWRIMRAMILEDKVDMARVLQYCTYMVKISTFAQTHKWDSILKYDREYRKNQADLDYPWGADSTYLMQLHLKVDPPATFAKQAQLGNQGGAKGPAKKSTSKFDPASGKPVCQRFNGRMGCSLAKCTYAHVCMTCLSGEHNDFNHHRTSGQSDSKKD
jgi:hypothetical protein